MYAAIQAYCADTINMDNLRGGDATAPEVTSTSNVVSGKYSSDSFLPPNILIEILHIKENTQNTNGSPVLRK